MDQYLKNMLDYRKTGATSKKSNLGYSKPNWSGSLQDCFSAFLKKEQRSSILWKDELSTKIKYSYGPDEIFEEYPSWQKEFYISYARKTAFLNIYTRIMNS